MDKIYIVGAGGFGRELLWWIKDINRVKPTWEIAGFLDDDLHALDNYVCDYSVIGTVAGWEVEEGQVFALGIASPEIKRKVTYEIEAKGGKFVDIIHPTALLSAFAEYGKGLVMFPYSKLSCNSKVGNFVTILSSPIGHDTLIGDYSVISGNCNVVRNVVIGKDVFLAAGVCIAQDIHIGDGAYLGLGAVVLNDVQPGNTVFGNPARVMPKVK